MPMTCERAAGLRFVGALKLSAGRMCGDRRLQRLGRWQLLLGLGQAAIGRLDAWLARAQRPGLRVQPKAGPQVAGPSLLTEVAPSTALPTPSS
jgi:hypothetical protein